MRLVRADWDKPHRCPWCWVIPERAHRHGRARVGRVYRCYRCRVWWARGFRPGLVLQRWRRSR